MPTRILTLTGASASGKTTIVKELRRGGVSHLVELIISTTTRAQRPDDLPGEYEYLKTEKEFEALRKMDRLLWGPRIGNHLYGTRKGAVDSLLQKPRKIGLMILDPAHVLDIKNYLRENYPQYSVWAIYIESPGAEELERRMIKQGRTEEEIRLRLQTDSSWDEMAREMGIFDEFIKNNKNDGGTEAAIHVADRVLALSKDLPR